MRKLIFLSLLLSVFFTDAQVSNSFDGNWEGYYNATPKNGKRYSYKFRLKCNGVKDNYYTNIAMFFVPGDSTKVLQVIDDYRIFPRPADDALTFNSLFKTPDGTECKGKFEFHFDGNNLLKLIGKFTPDEKNCMKLDMELNRVVGNIQEQMNQAGYSVGEINDKTIRLDVSELDDFMEGYAIIRKGENFAVIDNTGAYLIPWGKYKFNEKGGYSIDKVRCGFHNGAMIVRDPETEKYGFFASGTSSGLFVPCTLSDAGIFQSDGYCWGKEVEQNGTAHFYFIDGSGKKYPIKGSLINGVPTSLYMYAVQGANGYTEFYRKNGQLAFRTKRRVTGPYSDGLIKVDTSYELAGTKTGFIDTLNRLVIPYTFKGNVRNFHDGFAMVEGTRADEYRYAYIDKTGKITTRFALNDEIQSLWKATDCGAGPSAYTAWITINDMRVHFNPANHELHYMEKMIEKSAGNFAPPYCSFYWAADKFKAKCQIDEWSRLQYYNHLPFNCYYSYSAQKQFVTGGVNGGRKLQTAQFRNGEGMGLADLDGNIIIAPVFSELSAPDMMSGLAKASITDENTNVTTQGYINGLGVFTMIKADTKK